jgi:hypothetical protein
MARYMDTEYNDPTVDREGNPVRQDIRIKEDYLNEVSNHLAEIDDPVAKALRLEQIKGLNEIESMLLEGMGNKLTDEDKSSLSVEFIEEIRDANIVDDVVNNPKTVYKDVPHAFIPKKAQEKFITEDLQKQKNIEIDLRDKEQDAEQPMSLSKADIQEVRNADLYAAKLEGKTGFPLTELQTLLKESVEEEPLDFKGKLMNMKDRLSDLMPENKTSKRRKTWL